jgi:energy-converting hydrogenase B subunit D
VVPLQVVTMAFVALAAVGVVAARDIVRQAIVFSIYGFALVLLFLVLQAPDVALSALVVSGIAYPLVLVGAIARVHSLRKRGKP